MSKKCRRGAAGAAWLTPRHRRSAMVAARQALLGGDHELVDRDTFLPNPSYWIAYLWPRLMSTRVLGVTVSAAADTAASGSSGGPGGAALVRAYAHCGLLLGGVTLALVNISPSVSR